MPVTPLDTINEMKRKISLRAPKQTRVPDRGPAFRYLTPVANFDVDILSSATTQ